MVQLNVSLLSLKQSTPIQIKATSQEFEFSFILVKQSGFILYCWDIFGQETLEINLKRLIGYELEKPLRLQRKIVGEPLKQNFF